MELVRRLASLHPEVTGLLRHYLEQHAPRTRTEDPVPVPRIVFDPLCLAALAGLEAADASREPPGRADAVANNQEKGEPTMKILKPGVAVNSPAPATVGTCARCGCRVGCEPGEGKSMDRTTRTPKPNAPVASTTCPTEGCGYPVALYPAPSPDRVGAGTR